MAQAEDQRLGKSVQTEDMDDLRLKGRDGFAQAPVVVNLQRPEPEEGRDLRRVVGAIEEQTAVDLAVALFAPQPLGGSQHQDGVPARAQGLDHALAMSVKSARVMGWIQIGQRQNLHVGSSVQNQPARVKNEPQRMDSCGCETKFFFGRAVPPSRTPRRGVPTM